MLYRFNNIELDTTNFQLFVNSEEISVEPQVFNLIVFLIENRNKVVSREEIFEALWQGRIVSDTSINNHIKSARKVLDDDGHKQQVIKTLHSRGYQFILEPEVLTDIHFIKEKYTNIESQQKPSKTRYFITVSIVFIFSILWINKEQFDLFNHDTPTLVKHWNEQQVIAVLPFTNTKPDVKTDYLGFALANQVIGELVYLDKFTIRPAGSIRKYVNQMTDPITIGKELKANYLINGSYLKEKNIVRLNVELINTSSNEIVWRESIKVDYSNTFDLQDLVAARVATGLNASFTPKGINRKYRDTPNSALAYEYYLRGIAYPFSNEGHKIAVEMLEKSIQLDPNFAPSYAHLGNHRRLLEQHGRIIPSGSKNEEWYYRKALELNPELLEALNNLSLLYTETNRTEEALIIARKMIDINPNSADPHFSLGYIYRYAGMLDEAIIEMERALTISPNNSRFRSIISTYVSAGKYQLALSKTHLDKGDYGLGYSGLIFYNLENEEQALEYFNQVLAIDSEGAWGLIAQVYIAVIQGDAQTGLRVMDRMIKTNIKDAENTFYFATFYALLGDKDKSIEMLDKAVATGYFNYPHIVSHSAFNFMLDDERFTAILDKAKKRHDAFRKRFL